MRQKKNKPRKIDRCSWINCHTPTVARDPLCLKHCRLISRYRLTFDQVCKILEHQNGLCGLCQTQFSKRHPPVIDHNHCCCPGKGSCGKCVRGILHSTCNIIEGQVNRMMTDPDHMYDSARVSMLFQTYANVISYSTQEMGPW